MKQYFCGLEMQIPDSESYTGLSDMPMPNEKHNKFLKSNFEFPSDNIHDINKFICQDPELERIIYDLPEIISKEFLKCPILLDFMKYTLPNEVILQISIKTPFNGEITSSKKDKILQDLINNYNQPKNDYFISMEF